MEQVAKVVTFRKQPLHLCWTTRIQSRSIRGKLPQDFKVDGKQVRVLYQSPLAKAEMLDDFQNMQTWLGTMSQLFESSPESFAGVVKIEELPMGIAKMLGVDSNYIRSEDERAQIAEAVKDDAIGTNP